MFTYANIELTNKCNKHCWFCDRHNKEQQMTYGSMDLKLFEKILSEMNGVEMIQFHKDGEPLMYEHLKEVIDMCHKKGVITNIVTNGKNLVERINDIFNCTTITVSVFEKDDAQYEQVRLFLSKTSKPKLIIKLVGGYEGEEYKALGVPITKRQIHAPGGSYEYDTAPIMPEVGICWDFFKPSINWEGEMFICNRRDNEKKGLIGDLRNESIYELWYGEKRQLWLYNHKQMRRDLVPACKQCEYWGIPNA